MSNSVPKDWQVSKIGELIQKVIDNRGKTPPLSDKGKELIEINCLEIYKFPNYDLIKKYVSNKTYNSWFRDGHPKKGDILVSTVGSIGQFSIMSYDRGCIAQNIIAIRPKKNICNDYLYYACSGDTIKKKISSVLMGAVQPSLKVPDFLAINLHLPPLPEQKKIASILDAVDDLIENIQSKINKLQDLKKGTINKLLIKGIGHTEFKDSELGIVPKSWKIMELSKVSKILSSNVDKKTKESETSVLLCNYMDVYKNLKITREMNFMKASAKKSEIDKFLIKKDDVIITKDSETPDDIAISSYVSENFGNVLCGYHLSIIRPNKSVLDGKFLNFFFKLDYMHHRFSILANGTTRFGLNLKEVENSKILIPELEEQKKIANIICSLEDKISIIKKKLNKYVFIKKSLMQDLLTGKVRVSVN